MKKLLLPLLLFCGVQFATAQLSYDAQLKFAYSSSALFNKNISDLGASQDYDFAFSQNYGAAISVNYKFIGVGAELLLGNFVGGYQGGETVATAYTSQVKLTTTQIPLYLRLGGEEGSFSEFGVVLHNVKAATYSGSATTSSIDVTNKYQNFMGYMIGLGARTKLSKLPLAVSLSARLMYSPDDAKGVDALGDPLSTYAAPYKTNAASAGIHLGMVYLIK